MSKVIAIEFDEKTARVLVAKTAGSTLHLSSAFEVDFDSSFEDDVSSFGKEVADAIANKTGRCDA
ncbi:MAG: hypothetical protein VX776_11025, partial [Planctomycetota bacterium]|nr:hypothetical protein [Planctomycetota bacterium]MEC9097158.1 hypothetical protein [Planctomycetota bacterium]